MVAPFIHEFTYQAMVNDLLPIEDGVRYTFVVLYLLLFSLFIVVLRYKFQSSVGAYEDKTATLNDSDAVWTAVRHMHMQEAIVKLIADFNKFLEENAVFKGFVSSDAKSAILMAHPRLREGAANLNDMKEMLANLPQYQEQREKVVELDFQGDI